MPNWSLSRVQSNVLQQQHCNSHPTHINFHNIMCIYVLDRLDDLSNLKVKLLPTLSCMSESQPACIICTHIIKSKGNGHTITSQQEKRLQPFASRTIDVNVDRAHRDCWKNPNKYTKNKVIYHPEITYHVALCLHG